MALFSGKKKYEMINVDDPSARLSFRRGFMPLGDGQYVDEAMIEVSGFDKLIIIPEIELLSDKIIQYIVEKFDQYFEDNGDLPGTMLQNMASWMFAWGLDMAWRWNAGSLDKFKPEQDMSSFAVPMSKFSLMPQEWYSNLIETFMIWSYNHPGYTDKYEIDVYDPIRDGYLTMIRCAVTKTLPKIN